MIPGLDIRTFGPDDVVPQGTIGFNHVSAFADPAIAAQFANDRARQFAGGVPGAVSVIINPYVTAQLVLGQMQREPSFPEWFAPAWQVPSIKVKYPTWPNNEWMARKNTRRAESAPYGTSAPTPSTGETELDRYGWATFADVRTFNNADSKFNLQTVFSGFSQKIVRKNFEWDMAEVLGNVTPGATYKAGHITTLGAGDEWDDATVPLTPKQTVTALVKLICAEAGCNPRDLRGYGSQATYHALMANADFQTWNRGQVARQDDPTEAAAIGRYFGIGPVMFENAVGVNSSGTFTTLFSDVFIVFLPGVGGEYDTTFGERRFFGHWRMNAGVASEPWLVRENSSWWYPWDEEYKVEVLQNGAAGIVVNCAA